MDEHNNQVPIQKTKDGICIYVQIPPLTFSTFKIEKATKTKIIKDKNLTLENNYIKYKFNKNGNLISAYDKEIKKQIFPYHFE